MTEKRQIMKPFEFLGNQNGCKVRKYNSQGDGEIYTGHGGKVYNTVTAHLTKLNETTVRLILQYNVWEDSWEKGGSKADRLLFDAYKDIDLSSLLKSRTYVDEANNPNITIVETSSFDINSRFLGEFFMKCYWGVKDSRHGWLRCEESDYAKEGINKLCSWMITKGNDYSKRLYVKIDGSGNELNLVGNIGVKGTIDFPITITRHRERYQTPETEVTSNIKVAATDGNYKVLPSIPDKVHDVLGRGYFINGKYADRASLAPGFILDINKLNQYKRIECDTTQAFDGRTFKGEGSKDYQSKISESLSVSVSGGGWGVSFSNETKSTFSEEVTKKEEYKIKTIKNQLSFQLWRIQGTSANLNAFLSPQFEADLNSMTADQLIAAYGTHVLLGMQLGARLFYNMAYKKSLSSISTARTFSTTTSLAYNSSTGKPKKDDEGKSEKKTQFDEIMEKINEKANFNDPKIIAAVKDLLLAKNQILAGGTAAKSDAKSDASKSSNSGGLPSGATPNIAATVGVSTDSSTNSTEEAESLEVVCTGLGGEARYIKKIEANPDDYDKWFDSINESNIGWCDFVNKCVIPIYEFVPAGYKLSAQQVKKAWEKYLAADGLLPISKETRTMDFDLSGSSIVFNYGKNVLHNGNDPEICTQDGKSTGWRVRLELVNVENTVGLIVTYTVYEGGLHANRSVLQLYQVVNLDLKNCAHIVVDPSITPLCEFSGNLEGKLHDLNDITDDIIDQGGCDFLDLLGDRLKIRIDGGGDDYSNLRIKGSVRVPVLVYAK